MLVHEDDMCTSCASVEECQWHNHYADIVKARSMQFFWAACSIGSATIFSYLIAEGIDTHQSAHDIIAIAILASLIYVILFAFVRDAGQDVADYTSYYVHTNRRDIRRQARRQAAAGYEYPPPD